jgi:hypothetical protein
MAQPKIKTTSAWVEPFERVLQFETWQDFCHLPETEKTQPSFYKKKEEDAKTILSELSYVCSDTDPCNNTCYVLENQCSVEKTSLIPASRIHRWVLKLQLK